MLGGYVPLPSVQKRIPPSLFYILSQGHSVVKYQKAEGNGTYHKAGLPPPEKEKKGVRMFLSVLLFTYLALQGIVCYTFFGVLSGGNMSVKCFCRKT